MIRLLIKELFVRTLNTFQNFFNCFNGWLWTSKCLLEKFAIISLISFLSMFTSLTLCWMHGQEWTNFFLGAQHFACANNEWSKPKCTFDRDTTKVYVQSRYNPSVRSIEKQPKCTFDQDTTENIGFCSLLPKKDLQLSF